MSQTSSANRRLVGEHLSGRDVAKFTVLVALLGIFVDAAIGHGLAWHNDPYWTYWITKTFLIATVFGLGTAWLGIGEGRGALITLVHTIVLTVYYWSLSPIGTPSAPDWLDLEHTWGTGLLIHFGVIYTGYLFALWIWRRRASLTAPRDASTNSLAWRSVVVAAVITVVAGMLTWAVTGEFQGATWYVVRLLLNVPFLLVWWNGVGRDRIAAVAGGIMLGLLWATYGWFLGPLGLPDWPIRIFTQAPPGATSFWPTYQELWVYSLPIYAGVGVVVLLADSVRGQELRRPLAATAALLLGVMLLGAAGKTTVDQGQSATIVSSGAAQLETGSFYGNEFAPTTAGLHLTVVDVGGRVTPLLPHDHVSIEATVQAEGRSFVLTVRRPMVEDPLGRWTTWWGVGFDVDHHGRSGIGTSLVPSVHSPVALFGMGDLTMDGQLVASGVPVHAMTMDPAVMGGRLELDVGDPDVGVIPGIPAGHLRVMWTDYTSTISRRPDYVRYGVGSFVLVALLVAGFVLNRRDPYIRPPADTGS